MLFPNRFATVSHCIPFLPGPAGYRSMASLVLPFGLPSTYFVR